MDDSSDSASLVPGNASFWRQGKGKKKCERTHSDSSRFRSTKGGANLIGRERKDHVKSLDGVEHRDLSFLKAWPKPKRGATG
ncbi:hypothetical protein VCV18_012344 [Metarhizium anisopliae]